MTGSQYVIFTENSDFTLSNDPRLISNFVITKVQLSTLVSTQEELSGGLFKKNGGPSKQIWPTKKFSLFSLFLPDFCKITIPTDLQISTEEVQLIMSRVYPRNVFQMPLLKNGVHLKMSNESIAICHFYGK